jgi:hypothetical protein
MVVMRNIDVDYYDSEGNLQHETSAMFNLDVARIELELERFADTVYYYSGGWLELTTDVLVLEEPITQISCSRGSSCLLRTISRRSLLLDRRRARAYTSP